jgi:hypothetical protein
MNLVSVFAVILPAQPSSYALMALAFTAAIIIPVGLVFALLREKMAAKISTKTSTAPRTRFVAVRPVRPSRRHCQNPESIGA